MVIEHKNSVTLPKDYFARIVKNDYVDWISAIVREFLQNCVDAFLKVKRKSENIEWIVEKDWLRITDNGCSMDQNIIENVLLQLLGTDKGDESTGGKGRAKELLYFAWPEWSIKTRNLLVEGSFIDYTVKEVNDFFKGTISTVHYGEDVGSKLFEAFKKYINKCSFNQIITWNGERFEGMGKLEDLEVLRRADTSKWSQQMREAMKERGVVPFDYTIYKMPVRGTEVYVRSNGIFMFSEPFRTDKGLIFEIAPGLSKWVLTGNRDNFSSVYGDQYHMAVSLFANQDEKSAQRSLFGKSDEKEKDDDYDHREQSFLIANNFKGQVSYQIKTDISNLFYDHNLDGKEVKIELDPAATEHGDGKNIKYTFIGGLNARLSEDEKNLTFDRMLFSEQKNFDKCFKFSDVAFKGRFDKFKRGDVERSEDGRPMLAPVPYNGELVIYGYKISK